MNESDNKKPFFSAKKIFRSQFIRYFRIFTHKILSLCSMEVVVYIA